MKQLTIILTTFVCFNSYCQTLEELKLGIDIDTVVYRSSECLNCPITYDTLIFRKLKCGLYINNNKDIAYQSSILLNDYDRGIRYISWIYAVDKNDSINGGLKEMKYVIDTNTFKFYSHTYWGDKNKIYGFTPMSDGGTVYYVDNANPKKFKVFGETPYAMDKRYVYYKGKILEAADVRTFKVIMNEGLPELAKDKHGYYFSGERISEVQLKELKK